MKAKVKAVRLRAETTHGPAGALVTFGPTFNVIRGGNHRGKTQILQAIVYALGLEGMFGPGHNSRLGSALTQQLLLRTPTAAESESAANVLSSWCAVELENSAGESLTALRHVKHPNVKPNLVHVWNGPALTNVQAVDAPSEYFVRESGGLQSDRGFHSVLARFLGWDLPLVSRYSGGEIPLYPEVIFPFLYVDQRAWGSAAPRQVAHFQIREPTRRAVEYLLRFIGPAARTERYRHEERIATLRAAWTANRQAIQASASMSGARPIGIPEMPVGARSGSKGTVIATDLAEAGLEVLDGEEWIPLEDYLDRMTARLKKVRPRPDGPVSSVADIGITELRERLMRAESELSDLLTTARAVEQRSSLNEAQIVAIDRRIAHLEEERSRNQDVKTLLRLGGEQRITHLADDDCPTCHQSLALVESLDVGPTLDVDETIGLLNAQLATARGMREQTAAALAQATQAHAAVQRAADSVRAEIRALQIDLTSPADFPSTGEITERVVTEQRIHELNRIKVAAYEVIHCLQQIASEMAATRSVLNQLPLEFPAEDAQRRERLQQVMREQLTEFGFGSYDAQNVAIDEDTLRPERAGFDIDSDVSASDVVRTKIAYLNGIRELSSSVGGPHPGLLILDEPRQHELDEQHFRSALARLAAGSHDGDQVIVTSAASRDALMSMVSDTVVNIIDIGDSRVLQSETGPDALENAI